MMDKINKQTIKSLSKNMAAVLAFSILLFPASDASAELNGGAACMPATLGQALNRGFTTNQFGVTNPGTSGFFVVCPLTASSSDAYTRAFVGMEYTAVSGGTTNCVVRLSQYDNSSLNAVGLTVTRGSAGYAQNLAFITYTQDQQTNASIVCPLQPGETLIWYGTN
ncbi:MAG: hypothetical protein V7742_00290 [Halioglobus sp.]